MKLEIFLLMTLCFRLTFGQDFNKFSKQIVENPDKIGVLAAPFVIDELIAVYEEDSLIIKRIFNEEIFDRTVYTKYCYNVCANFFFNRLLEKKDKLNNVIIEKIQGDLVFSKDLNKPDLDWGKVFSTCLTCPFGEYPDEMYFYFQFSLMFMEDEEIKSMIRDENGRQWNYVMEDIKYGDLFTLSKDENVVQFVIDRRIASYIIERWKDSDIPEVQKLIEVYRSVM